MERLWKIVATVREDCFSSVRICTVSRTTTCVKPRSLFDIRRSSRGNKHEHRNNDVVSMFSQNSVISHADDIPCSVLKCRCRDSLSLPTTLWPVWLPRLLLLLLFSGLERGRGQRWPNWSDGFCTDWSEQDLMMEQLLRDFRSDQPRTTPPNS